MDLVSQVLASATMAILVPMIHAMTDTANTPPTPALLAMIVTVVLSMIFARMENVREVLRRIATITTLVPMIHALTETAKTTTTTPILVRTETHVHLLILAEEDLVIQVFSSSATITRSVPTINATKRLESVCTPSTPNLAMMQTSAP